MSVMVIVEIHVKPDSLKDFHGFAKRILPDTSAFDGCLGLEKYSNQDDKENLVLVERWKSRGHFDRYLAWRMETGGLGQMLEMLAGTPSIRFFDQQDY